MSAVSSKPAIPRPTVRSATVPPPAPASTTRPLSVRPSSPVAVPGSYESEPPVIRDRMPTLELAEDDLVEAEAVAAIPRSTPPPPLPARSTIVPKLQGITVPKITPLAAPSFEPLPMPHTLALIAAVPTLVPAATPAPVATATPAPASIPAARLEPASRVDVKRVRAAEPVKPRLESMFDPAEVLFEGMYELELVDSAWEAARVCATALGRALGARAVVVHSHDLARRELRAIGVHGDRTGDVLGSADLSDDDLVASAVICNEKPVTMRFDGELPRLAPRRLEVLGAPRTLVAVPAMAWGRCVAMIEIIDADDRFAARVADSAAYVAERLAAYLSGRLAA